MTLLSRACVSPYILVFHENYVSGTVSEIQRDIGRFLIPPFIRRPPPLGGPGGNIAMTFGMK